jgi:molecular chaperone GrpE
MTDGEDRTSSHEGGGGVSASEEARHPEDDPRAGSDAELARMEDRYKRAVADLDNYRKRVARELEERVSARTDAVTRDWLEAVDSVERALRGVSHEADPAGLRSVLDQMEAILARYGVRRVGAVGEPFDPGFHEAIDVQQRDDVPDLTIVDVVRSGFTIGGRVLRPALVVVSRRPEPPA